MTDRALRQAKSEVARLTAVLQDLASGDYDDPEPMLARAQAALADGASAFLSEAEELRAGLEELIEHRGETAREMIEFDGEETVVRAVDLHALLDRVDARDSLEFLLNAAQRDRLLAELASTQASLDASRSELASVRAELREVGGNLAYIQSSLDLLCNPAGK